ncbi:MAG: glycosyltransferase family 2 protein [Vibrionaceae bacterium]
MDRQTISAIIITKNEQHNLPACLASLSWVDEIIVVDSGSEDETCAIAAKAGAKVFSHPDWPGFGKQKQRAQHYATQEWILAIDADEVVTPQLQASILAILARPAPYTLYTLRRSTWVFGRFLRHSGWYDKIVRLYPRTLTGYNDALVHEKVVIPPDVQNHELEGDLLHYTYQNLHQYLVKSAFYAKSWADDKAACGKKATLTQALTHAMGCFLKMYLLKRGFLDGKQGFLIAILSAHSTFIKYADLWIRDNDSRAN